MLILEILGVLFLLPLVIVLFFLFNLYIATRIIWFILTSIIFVAAAVLGFVFLSAGFGAGILIVLGVIYLIKLCFTRRSTAA